MKNPRPWRGVWAIGAHYPGDPMALLFTPDRGFIEPVTNLDAAPVIGPVIAWRYRGQTRESDNQVYDALAAETAP